MQFENVKFPDTIGFQCKNCGVCCRDQPPDINLKEQKNIEAKGFKDFLENSKDLNSRNFPRKKDKSCLFLTEENKCKIHDVKPLVCILEPFVITDFDCKTNLIALELNPDAAMNCPGVFSGEMVAPEEIAKAAQTIVNTFIEIVAGKMGLPVEDKKVASLARKLLLNNR
jgi:Fe-S-cluster containining protein